MSALSPDAPAAVLAAVVAGFHAVDHGIADTDPPITEDFSLTMGDRSISAEEYRSVLQARAQATYTTRHLVSNFQVVDVGDDGALHVEFVATVHRLEDGAERPTFNVVDFADEWVPVAHRWVQRARTISPVIIGGGS